MNCHQILIERAGVEDNKIDGRRIQACKNCIAAARGPRLARSPSWSRAPSQDLRIPSPRLFRFPAQRAEQFTSKSFRGVLPAYLLLALPDARIVQPSMAD